MLTLKEFNKHIIAIYRAEKAMNEDTDHGAQKAQIRQGRLAYKHCVKTFNDKHKNLRRWLDKKPCIFRSPITGKLVDIKIGNETEAIYYFLEFCRRLNCGEYIDDEFSTYLAYVITRSNNIKAWSES